MERINSGIYCVKCLVNNKKYIGSAKNFDKKQRDIFKSLRQGKHVKKLQYDYNKYGKDNFTFEIIEKFPLKNLAERESYWIKKLNTIDNNIGYNTVSWTYRNSEEKLKEISKKVTKTLKGRKLPKEHKNNISKAMKGNTYFSEEHRKKLSNALKGNNCKKGYTKISKEQALEIKKLLLEETGEKVTKKDERIAKIYSVYPRQILNIRTGKHTLSEFLNGSLKDWQKE